MDDILKLEQDKPRALGEQGKEPLEVAQLSAHGCLLQHGQGESWLSRAQSDRESHQGEGPAEATMVLPDVPETCAARPRLCFARASPAHVHMLPFGARGG